MNQDKIWLVRSSSGDLRGPFSTKEFQDLVGQGSFHHSSEICLPFRYWFSISANSEMKAHKELAERFAKDGLSILESISDGELAGSGVDEEVTMVTSVENLEKEKKEEALVSEKPEQPKDSTDTKKSKSEIRLKKPTHSDIPIKKKSNVKVLLLVLGVLLLALLITQFI